MINLHPPFRFATERDAEALSRFATLPHGLAIASVVLCEEGSGVTAALQGSPRGDAWRVELLVVQPDRLDEIGPRILAVADALAADDGLASVLLAETSLVPELRDLALREGFKRTGEGRLARAVIPQG